MRATDAIRGGPNRPRIRRALLVLASLVACVPVASADDKKSEFSVGYSYVGGFDKEGRAPLGAYFAYSEAKPTAFELNLGLQAAGSVLPNFLTLTLGPRFRRESGAARPFFHVLGGIRAGTVLGDSAVAGGGQAGGGVETKVGTRAALRLGADLEIFFHRGDNVSLHLVAGITF